MDDSIYKVNKGGNLEHDGNLEQGHAVTSVVVKLPSHSCYIYILPNSPFVEIIRTRNDGCSLWLAQLLA